jgi:single-strand DNA-binding protein
MNETHVTIVGNALHRPEWRKTANTGALVTTFKIASTARRFSSEAGRWIDGNSLRVRVSCWRALAENVKNSVTRGDPLIVTGRLCTRDWEDENGIKRTSFELEASSVGHDLSKGRAVFERVKSATSTSVTPDAEAEQRIGGEPTEPVLDAEAPTQFNDMSYEEALDGGLAMPSSLGDGDSAGDDPVGALRDGGFTTSPLGSGAVSPDELSPDGDEAVPDELTLSVAEPEPDGAPEPEGADSDDADSLAPAAEPRPGRRRGMRRSRVPA